MGIKRVMRAPTMLAANRGYGAPSAGHSEKPLSPQQRGMASADLTGLPQRDHGLKRHAADAQTLSEQADD